MELQIPKLVHDKIMYWIDKTDQEVSGFGKILWNAEEKAFVVSDVWLVKQEVGAAHTDIDETAIGKLLYQTKDMPGDLRFWWHSHVNMDVFWSGTDTETIKSLGSKGWIVASVFNKKREIRTAFCYKTQWKELIDVKLIDEIQTFILDPDISPELVTEWDKAFEECVTKKIYTPASYYTGAKEITGNSYLYSTDPEDQAWNQRWGILGYGIAEEAKVLGMSKTSLERIIKDNLKIELDKLEAELLQADAAGEFRHVTYY